MIKYSEACLGGRRNRLLAHLLEKLVHLCGTLCLWRLHKQDGRMAHNRRLAHDAARHERSLILLSGLSKGDDVVDVYDEETCLVQVCSLAGDVRYTVCLSTQSCDCPDSSKGFVCKHQWVAQAILPPGGFKSWSYYGVGNVPLRDIMTAELVQQSSMPTTLDLGPYALPVIDTSFQHTSPAPPALAPFSPSPLALPPPQAHVENVSPDHPAGRSDASTCLEVLCGLEDGGSGPSASVAKLPSTSFSNSIEPLNMEQMFDDCAEFEADEVIWPPDSSNTASANTVQELLADDSGKQSLHSTVWSYEKLDLVNMTLIFSALVCAFFVTYKSHACNALIERAFFIVSSVQDAWIIVVSVFVQ
jgi:hypothetical protein